MKRLNLDIDEGQALMTALQYYIEHTYTDNEDLPVIENILERLESQGI